MVEPVIMAGQVKNGTTVLPGLQKKFLLLSHETVSGAIKDTSHAMCRGLSEIYHKPQNRTENPVLPESAVNWRKCEKYGMRVHFL